MLRSTFLNRLVGIAGLGFLPVDKLQATRKIYLLQTFVAGFRFHKGMGLLPHLQDGDLLELRREPHNSHDAFAIAVCWQQEMVGYLPATANETLARLMDAKALPLVACITHLNKVAKPWENVAIAVYFLQPQATDFPDHAAYLTTVEKPNYTTIIVEDASDNLPDLLDYYNRVINLDAIPDEEAKSYFEKWFDTWPVAMGYGNFVHVKNDGIYHYLYNVEAVGWVHDIAGKRWLEFNWTAD